MQGAITTFTKGAAAELIKKGIRMNAIAPGPVWTPLVPSSFPEDMVRVLCAFRVLTQALPLIQMMYMCCHTGHARTCDHGWVPDEACFWCQAGLILALFMFWYSIIYVVPSLRLHTFAISHQHLIQAELQYGCFMEERWGSQSLRHLLMTAADELASDHKTQAQIGNTIIIMMITHFQPKG